MMTDPISDLATRIRNGLQVEATHVDLPTSNLKVQVAAALQREGFIWDFETHAVENAPGGVLRINLKYGPSGERVVRSIKRISKPGRRVYYGCENMPNHKGLTARHRTNTTHDRTRSNFHLTEHQIIRITNATVLSVRHQ
jgi:small subunit ribosomal protein S8